MCPRRTALIIGVGAYPHLRGGTLFATEPARYHLGMKQLDSPPVSAREFADWLIKSGTSTHRNGAAPLGTVELLISSNDPNDASFIAVGMTVAVEEATFYNIQKAFDRWFMRCDRHVDNIGVFYFCGHGLEREKSWLLASDYGDNPGLRVRERHRLQRHASGIGRRLQGSDGRQHLGCLP